MPPKSSSWAPFWPPKTEEKSNPSSKTAPRPPKTEKTPPTEICLSKNGKRDTLGSLVAPKEASLCYFLSSFASLSSLCCSLLLLCVKNPENTPKTAPDPPPDRPRPAQDRPKICPKSIFRWSWGAFCLKTVLDPILDRIWRRLGPHRAAKMEAKSTQDGAQIGVKTT